MQACLAKGVREVPRTAQQLGSELRLEQARASGARDVGAMIKSVELMVLDVARRYGRNLGEADREDLEAAGRVGALTAAERFDPDHGAAFPTYAWYYIREAVKAEVFRIWGKGRVPSGVVSRKIFQRSNKVRREIAGQGVDATDEDIAAKLDVGVEDLRSVLRALSDQEVSATAVDDSPDALDRVFDHQRREVVCRALLSLDTRERFVLRALFFDDRVLEDVGSSLGVSRQRVGQIKLDALNKLRNLLLDVAE